jgi:hypothetical protein
LPAVNVGLGLARQLFLVDKPCSVIRTAGCFPVKSVDDLCHTSVGIANHSPHGHATYQHAHIGVSCADWWLEPCCHRTRR